MSTHDKGYDITLEHPGEHVYPTEKLSHGLGSALGGLLRKDKLRKAGELVIVSSVNVSGQGTTFSVSVPTESAEPKPRAPRALAVPRKRAAEVERVDGTPVAPDSDGVTTLPVD